MASKTNPVKNKGHGKLFGTSVSSKPTLEEILGRAKSTLNQSRQFRDGRTVTSSKPGHLIGASTGGASMRPVHDGKRKLDEKIGSRIQLRTRDPSTGLEQKQPTDYVSSN